MIRFNCPNCNRPYELSPALAFLPLVCKQCGQRITPPADEPGASPPPPPVAKSQAAKAVLPVAQVVAPPVAKPQTAPVAPPTAKPVAPPPTVKPVAPLKPKPALTPVDDDEDGGVLVTKADTSPDIDFNVGGPTAASLSDATRARPAGLSDATRPRPAELDGVTEADINLDLLGPAPAPAPKREPKAPEPEAPPEPRPEPTLVPFIADLVVFVALVVVGMFVGEMLTGKTTGQVLSESGSSPKFPPMDLILWGGPPVTFALIYLLLGARKATVGEWLRRRRTR